MPRPRNRIVMYLEENGPATPSTIAAAIGWQTDSVTAELSKLRRNDKIHVCGTVGTSNLWDAGGGEPKLPDTQEIVTAALASQPALATVWRAL